MAIGDNKHVYTDPHFEFASTDMSAAVSKVSVMWTHPVSDTRRAGQVGPDRVVSPVYDWQVEVDFQLDSIYAASEVNATIMAEMRPPVGASGKTGIAAVIVRGDSEAVGATNPQISGNVVVESWTPFGAGQVGEFVVITKTFMGSGAMTFATS